MAEQTLEGTVECVLVSTLKSSPASIPQDKIKVLKDDGVKGDRHAGTRLLDVRERKLKKWGLPKGMEIANFREFSAVSREELTAIADCLNLPGPIPAGALGENLIVSGIPKFSELPKGTFLFFKKNQRTKRTAVLAVWDKNQPCRKPGEVIQYRFPDVQKVTSRFSKCAIDKRGVVGKVYCSGNIASGDTVIAKLPN